MHDLDLTLSTRESEAAFEVGASELNPEIFGELDAEPYPPENPAFGGPGDTATTVDACPCHEAGGRQPIHPRTGRWFRHGRKLVVLGV